MMLHLRRGELAAAPCPQCGALDPDAPETQELCRYPACGDGCIRELAHYTALLGPERGPVSAGYDRQMRELITATDAEIEAAAIYLSAWRDLDIGFEAASAGFGCGPPRETWWTISRFRTALAAKLERAA